MEVFNFRMYKGWSATSLVSMFTSLPTPEPEVTQPRLQRTECRLDLRRHFFSECVVYKWSCLEQHIINWTTVNAYKNRLRQTTAFFQVTTQLQYIEDSEPVVDRSRNRWCAVQ